MLYRKIAAGSLRSAEDRFRAPSEILSGHYLQNEWKKLAQVSFTSAWPSAYRFRRRPHNAVWSGPPSLNNRIVGHLTTGGSLRMCGRALMPRSCGISQHDARHLTAAARSKAASLDSRTLPQFRAANSFDAAERSKRQAAVSLSSQIPRKMPNSVFRPGLIDFTNQEGSGQARDRANSSSLVPK